MQAPGQSLEAGADGLDGADLQLARLGQAPGDVADAVGLAALGADYMATVDPQSTVFADYGPLDAFCTELIDTALPGLLDSDDWGVWSDQVNRIAGWEEYDGTIDPSLTYPVY